MTPEVQILYRIEYLLCLLLGGLVKLADVQIDLKICKRMQNLDYALAIFYGIVAGYLLSTSTAFSTVGLATIVTVLVAGKATHRTHQIGIASTLFVAGLLGMHPLAIAPFLVLIAAIGVDVWIAHAAKKDTDKLLPGFRELFLLQLTKDFAALGLSIYYAEPEFFLAMLLFDIGYKGVKYFAKKK